MLAIAKQGDQSHSAQATLATRLGYSLCAGIGGNAGTAELDGMAIAYRPLRTTAAAARAWRPSMLAGGQVVVFHGYFDNSAEIAAELAVDPHDLARLYGLAVQRWQDEAERRIIGHYCAVIADPVTGRLRLSRSPLQAPPLYYFHDQNLTAAASVPRALFAAGVEQKINEMRIADILMRNFHDEEATPYERIAQVPTGSVVTLEPNRPRALHKWYNLLDLPWVEVTSDAAVVARAGELLDEGVRACLAGFRRPGSTLSGGLDSPQVAVRALNLMPPGRKLPTFTFHPEDRFDGRAPRWKMADERPFVERFTAMHPGLEPHFTANEGYEHDHRCNELFHLIGDPTGVPGTYVFHGLMSEAAKNGCDLLLLAEWGNVTFSDRGDCAFVEYLLKGQWRQLWLALTRPPIHRGSIFRRFIARSLSALLPDRIWRLMHHAFTGRQLLSDKAQPLSAEYRRVTGADERLRRTGRSADRHQPWSRRHARSLLLGSGDPAPFHQGLEQMYGVALRDPTAYRPFVEYCLGLPAKMFMRDGETRWLAKEMAKGMMPEEQRANARGGWWDADGQTRIRRRRPEWLAELDRLHEDERFGQMFDVPRLRSALKALPETTETDPQKFITAQLAVPLALLTARFVTFVEGRNQC